MCPARDQEIKDDAYAPNVSFTANFLIELDFWRQKHLLNCRILVLRLREVYHLDDGDVGYSELDAVEDHEAVSNYHVLWPQVLVDNSMGV